MAVKVDSDVCDTILTAVELSSLMCQIQDSMCLSERNHANVDDGGRGLMVWRYFVWWRLNPLETMSIYIPENFRLSYNRGRTGRGFELVCCVTRSWSFQRLGCRRRKCWPFPIIRGVRIGGKRRGLRSLATYLDIRTGCGRTSRASSFYSPWGRRGAPRVLNVGRSGFGIMLGPWRIRRGLFSGRT